MFTQKYTLNNKNLIFATYNHKNYYNISFSDFEMIGNASLSNKIYSYYNVILHNLTIQKGISNILNVDVKYVITLNPGSILNIDRYCTINTCLETINLEWDLNQPCLLNSSILLNLNPKVINIIYKGSSIRKRKLLFDEFLENGTAIMINVNKSILNKIHFIAENDKEFNDGEDLALTCKVVNKNEIHLFTTRQLYNESEVFETDSPSASPSESATPSFSPEPTYSPTFSPEPTYSPTFSPVETPIPTDSPSEIITSTLEVYEPTKKPDEPIKPAIDSYTSNGQTITFEKNGFYDDETFIPVEENKINLIKSEKSELTLKTSKSESNQLMFVSPQLLNAVISILSSSEIEDDFGGEFGVHANSNNPQINLPQNKVPLNIFNDEESEINLVLAQKYSKLLEVSTLSFEKLIISDGNLNIKVNDNRDIEFEKIETFLNSQLRSYFEQIPVEIKIKSLIMNPKSSITIVNANFDDAIIKSNEETKIIIQRRVKFNENTLIDVTDLSLIDFGESQIDGIPNKIKIENKMNSMNDVNLICGVNFDCPSWKEKYEENSFYKYSKCTNNNNEKCLTVSSVDNQNLPKSKKPLSGGAIAGIVIAVIVVVAAAAVVGFFIWKKRNKYEKSDDEMQGDDSPEDKQL